MLKNRRELRLFLRGLTLQFSSMVSELQKREREIERHRERELYGPQLPIRIVTLWHN